MNIREIALPGIGQKYELVTKNNDKVVIVIHDDGRREVFHFDDDDHEESISCVVFNDIESRQIAGILGGMAYKPKALETIEVAFNDLIIEWYKVESGSKVVNQTIGNSDIRNKYNVNVIAIMKKNTEKMLSPGPETVIEAGDTLVISGERQSLKKLILELLSRNAGGET
ncbi:cation:proton antiporter regulatory subunit [Niallia sp. 01092]|uniref:cation:proton antiporter regulatory subunit n=1 Tax=unclassified Niallia TaxID=2837522 RepID=UPI003FD351DF